MAFRIMNAFRDMRVCIAFSLLCIALTSCNQQETRRVITTTDLEKLSPFVAEVDRIYVNDYADSDLVTRRVVLIGLNIADREKITLGDSGTNVDLLLAFAHMITNGTSYRFPDVWLDYKRAVENGPKATNEVPHQ